MTVEVEVSEAGTVDIPDLGLTAPADPVTPARFDVSPPARGATRCSSHPPPASSPSRPEAW